MSPELPWLQNARQLARTALRGPRPPHSVLVTSRSGAGLASFGRWLCRLRHCTSADDAPCGSCRSCQWFDKIAHPDHLELTPEEDSEEIRIDQVRALIEQLSMTGHGGRYRSALLYPAERLNRHAANALLKLLEEPPSGSLLVLAAQQPMRLPATIRSRCLRISLPAPRIEEGAAWLTETSGGDAAVWRQLLSLLGNRPDEAREWDPSQKLRSIADLERDLQRLASGDGEPLLMARQWDDALYTERLLILENLITKKLLGGSGNATLHLPLAADLPKLRLMFDMLDRIRDERRLAESPLNRRHSLTVLLSGLQSAFRAAGGGLG